MKKITSISIIALSVLILFDCKKEPDNDSNPNKLLFGQTTIDSVSYRELMVTTHISNLGGNTVLQYGHCWDTISNPEINDNLTTTNGNPSNLSINSSITGLNSARKYFVRAFCKLSHTTVYSSEIEITTLKTGKPLISSLSISEITINSAKCNGIILSDSGLTITERGVCWDTVSIFNVSDCLNKMTGGAGTGQFICQVSNLMEGKNYFIKVYAINQAGTSYGDLMNFQTTPITLPEVTTTEITKVTTNSAQCGGNVINAGNGTVTAKGVCWNTSGNPTLENNSGITVDGTGIGNFSSYLQNLIYPQQYFVSAYATNEKGTSYGNEKSFETQLLCGELTIVYEGQIYHTVLIGTQCWIKENLNVGSRINANETPLNNGVIEKYCYNDIENNCDVYGGLYQWNEALNYDSSELTGICPSGWHIPTDNEFKILEGNIDSQYLLGDPVWDQSSFRGYDSGKKLKSALGWKDLGNGTDNYNFNIIPGGYRFTDNSFIYITERAIFWTSTEIDAANSLIRQFRYTNDNSGRYSPDKSHGFSIRCIMD